MYHLKQMTSIDNLLRALRVCRRQKHKKLVKLRKVNSELKKQQMKRENDEVGIENLLYTILEESHIQKQHFHGGAMNGVCCRRLLDNLEVIFPKIRKIASRWVLTN